MPRLADATAYLKTDNTDLKKGLDQGEQQVEGWGGRLGGVMQGVGMAVGMGVANIAMQAVGQVTQFMGDAVAAASDMGETISKTNVLFGEGADAVIAFAETAATQFGQSKQQALDAATTFATFGSAAGLAGDDLTKFSTDFVGLASDLASFNNTTPEQAIQAIGAALRGEAEPMRQYGVLLDDASMRQQALKMGLIETTTQALTPQQKVLAAQALIYEQTSAAQGDFARTSGGLANQQRILDAQMANLSATVGQALLPVVLAFTSALNTLVQAVLPPLQAFMATQVIPVMEEFGALISATLGPALNALMGWFGSLGQSVQGTTDGPLSYMQAWWIENMPRIQQIVDTVLGAITAFWDEHGAAITATVEQLLNWLVRFWDTQMKTIMDVVTVFLQVLTGDWEGAGQTIQGILSRWQQFFYDAFQAIVQTIRNIDWRQVGQSIIDTLWDGIRNAWNAGSGILSQWQQFFDTSFQAIVRTIRSIDWRQVGQSIIDTLWDGIRNAWNAGSGIVSQWQQFFTFSFQDIVRTITNIDWWRVGQSIIDILWDGMRNAWDAGVDWFEDRLRELRDMLPFSEPRDPASPLRGLAKSGEAIVGMIQQGIDQAANWTLPTLGGPEMAGAGVGAAPISITINIGGGGDASGVGAATRDGVLSALRAAGLR